MAAGVPVAEAWDRDGWSADRDHYVTVCDHRFMPQAFALHRSLRRWRPAATLWVVCVDADAASLVERADLPGLAAIAVRDHESDALRAARLDRSYVEFIHALTPFAYEFVARRAPAARRITYVDTDLYFFGDPGTLQAELDAAARSVMITEHGFAPQYAHLEAASGRFCVQFIPVEWNDDGRSVVADWQRRCLASTGRRRTGETWVFGDQGYVADWPAQFPAIVHVGRQANLMLAPWNATHEMQAAGADHRPVFHHFHSWRRLPGGWVQLAAGYDISGARSLYAEYLADMRAVYDWMLARALPIPAAHAPDQSWWWARLAWRALRGRVTLGRLPTGRRGGG